MFSMVVSAYIEVTINLVEAIEVLNQAIENGFLDSKAAAQTTSQCREKRHQPK